MIEISTKKVDDRFSNWHPTGRINDTRNEDKKPAASSVAAIKNVTLEEQGAIWSVSRHLLSENPSPCNLLSNASTNSSMFFALRRFLLHSCASTRNTTSVELGGSRSCTNEPSSTSSPWGVVHLRNR
ncbi:unnamed protein product, partial [Iphiclides podalirius]